MGKAHFVFALFLSVAGAGAAPDEPLRDVTEAIGLAEDGRLMQMHGIIDDCLPDSCFLCPDWETASKPEQRFHRRGCLALMSWKDSNAGLLLDEMFRFSDVIVTGRFHFNKPTANADVDVLCLDLRRCEQSGFENVVVDRLIERRPVEQVPHPSDPIAFAVTSEDDAALRKLFWEDTDFSLVSLLDSNDIRTYTRPQRDRGTGLEGWLCYRRASVVVNPDEPFPWPTSYRAVELRSPANPYRCLHAWKDKGAWRIIRDIHQLPVYGLD